MKPIRMFIQAGCPYCKAALKWINELKEENPAYQALEMTIIDENIERALAQKYDYYYVPTFYVNEEKKHEGAATKQLVKQVFDAAIQDA